MINTVSSWDSTSSLHFWPENELSEIKCLIPAVHVQPLGGIGDLDGDSNETVKLVFVDGSLGLKLKYLQRAKYLENCSTDKKTRVTQQLASDLDQEYVDRLHTAVVDLGVYKGALFAWISSKSSVPGQGKM
jgi:hypothetical protein